MKLAIRVRPEAESDIHAAFLWYETQELGLGKRFVTNLDVVFVRLAKFPEIHAEAYRGVRQTMVRKFPYIVCYLLHSEEIEVIAVIHAHRDPSEWKSRSGC